MKSINLKAQVREELGKSRVKKIRDAGSTPAVIYTPEGPVHIKLLTKEVNKILFTPETFLVNLDVDGKTYTATVKNSSYHPVHDYVLDVEFQLVSESKPVQVLMPVKLTGNSAGVLAGGRLIQKARSLKVRGNYKDLPEKITLDISDLRLGHSLKVRDISFDKFIVAEKGDVPIASVELTRTLRQEAATKAPVAEEAAPEEVE